MAKAQEFIERVQEHERTWGNDSYPGRPSLSEVLSAPVVVFWQRKKDKKTSETITIHDSVEELERYFARLLLAVIDSGDSRAVPIVYQNQKRMTIRGVKVYLKEAEDSA